MAIAPNPNQAFLREVDDELRRDQMLGIWSRWGRWLVAGIVIALLLFGGYLYWRHRQTLEAQSQGEALVRAYDTLGSGQSAAALKALSAFGDDAAPGYRAMARFTEADVLLQRNDLKGAAAKFAGVAGDTDLPEPLRHLALVRQTSAEFDALPPQQVVERLRPLAVQGSPFFASAGELVAAAHVRANRRDLAQRLFAQIGADAQTPETVRQRAVQMATVLAASPAAPARAGAQNKDATAQ